MDKFRLAARLFRWFSFGAAMLLMIAVMWLATHRSDNAQVMGRYSVSYSIVLLTLAGSSALLFLGHRLPIVQRSFGRLADGMLAMVSLTIALVVAEVLVRWTDPLGISYYEESARFNLIGKRADDELNYALMPNHHGTYQGITISTNVLGLRDVPIGTKQAGELRVMVLGDSVAFGWGVNAEDGFARKLGRVLQEQLGRSVTSINTGVGSYNTTQELGALKRYHAIVEPDLVVLMFVANDIHSVSGPFKPERQFSLSDRSPPEVVTFVALQSRLVRLIHFLIKDSNEDVYDRANPADPGFAESMRSMVDMARFCNERRVPFVVFQYRVSESSVRVVTEEVVKVGHAHKIPVVDTAPWWLGLDMRAHTNSVVDSHPNARGHAVLTQGIADYVVRNRLLPKDALMR
jgi:lysophospholipase L1-like esterase